MVFATLFPLGVLQLYHSVSVGYFDARSLTFLTNQTNTLLEWLRLDRQVLELALLPLGFAEFKLLPSLLHRRPS